MLNHLESLCRLCGASGQEHPVRDYLIEQIKPLGIPYQIDPLGNLIVEKKGKQTPPKKWMIGAHMDEVGLIVTYINENGTMKLAPVGGIDPSVVIGRAVQVGEQRIPGVIGAKHRLSLTCIWTLVQLIEKKRNNSFSRAHMHISVLVIRCLAVENWFAARLWMTALAVPFYWICYKKMFHMILPLHFMYKKKLGCVVQKQLPTPSTQTLH